MNRKRVLSALEQMNYNWHNFTVSDFIQRLIDLRRRPIAVMGVQLEVSGLCISTTAQDYIFYDLQRHQTVQLHAILHETAHLLMDHQAFVLSVHDVPHLRKILLHVNMRSARIYQDPQMNQEEDKAEYFAFLAQRAITEGQRRKDASLTDVSEDNFIPPLPAASAGVTNEWVQLWDGFGMCFRTVVDFILCPPIPRRSAWSLHPNAPLVSVAECLWQRNPLLLMFV